MKIQPWSTHILSTKLESVAKKINQTVSQIGIQDPSLVVEQIQEKAGFIFKRLRSSLLGSKSLRKTYPLSKNQVRKKVRDNLEGHYQQEEIVELITDCLYQAAKEDPKQRQRLGF